MFDGFFTRIGTVMGLGARHGRRGFPREEHGISIPVWGEDSSGTNTVEFNQTNTTSADANVTPLRSGGIKHG